ncbi:DUF4097 family beta strand repeat-containing protein [Dysgonomonas sp. Marseille-P4361]|uniref:DUF4097 family beta strand repeat-containing protein n=1 Tax=Dysgonomonas sp. Marseille-P4361 TaxID=2161820 RepID=UPI000D555CD7|nr:DUF4097 family beta strand repeat-containing protein [Dysgonomonas sp. Marseille-P4361]
MKKYITLLILICFTTFQVKAENYEKAQDSIKFDFSLDMKQLKKDIQKMQKDIKSKDLADLNSLIDSDQLKAMKEDLKKNLGDMKNNLRNDLNISVFNNNSQQDRNPTRTEKRTFSNVSEIEFFHSYGNIIVKETNSNQIDLEIQYFDTKNQQAVCNTKITNKLLTISTASSGRNNTRAKINYIVSIPKNTTLNIDLKYGSAKLDRFSGLFNGDLAYSNLSAEAFTSNAIPIKMKYSELKIEEAKNINLNASYSDIRIRKANSIEVEGNYNDYNLGDIQSLTTTKSSAYGDIRIKSVGTMNANIKYIDVSIDNLINDLDITTAYGDISIRDASTKLKNIKVKASYADVKITLPQDLSASFETDLSYGDMSISKQYKVSYTEQLDKNNKVRKKGKIGSKSPTATIYVTNSYADFKIR